MNHPPVHIIGAGLAGSEAAWQLAQRGITVKLYEMRPHQTTPAHQTAHCGELVCSNSLRSDDAQRSAVGVLHQEMRELNGLIMAAGDANRVPAGSALAVDREGFSDWITKRIESHPLITLVRKELTKPPQEGYTLIATGPLTSDPLAQWLENMLGRKRLAFFDALAPIVSFESIDFDIAWKQSRYGKGEGDDYINCPMDQAQYEAFIDGLLDGEKVAFREFEKIPYFDGCLPIEVMAERGRETPRFGPMKPVGLNNPHHNGQTPWAVVQLRQDNKLGTLWNIVGFQTKLTHGEQVRLFRTIPGLEKAEFMRLGALHRNTFIDSPKLLTPTLQLKSQPNLLFAGQIIGVEGYVESAAMGLLAGLFLTDMIQGRTPSPPPATTAHGALLNHVTNGVEGKTDFQPMNINFGLFPPLQQKLAKRFRKTARSERALKDLQGWLESPNAPPKPRTAENG
ncbi:MAG: methylenetetrahydrofolate--tRNA-(uracil(54)-C(5))-methyltransferase (FADH(2)-oxidizing) TrmFO [Magnetococcales bacterium]|nr:methylenetetrahydrofolate--tRNA-(uracil(54)-C(5))-methyltransferase (FADH(2)-oxidizing) TrmFO [Magnetococcales bacterium]